MTAAELLDTIIARLASRPPFPVGWVKLHVEKTGGAILARIADAAAAAGNEALSRRVLEALADDKIVGTIDPEGLPDEVRALLTAAGWPARLLADLADWQPQRVTAAQVRGALEAAGDKREMLRLWLLKQTGRAQVLRGNTALRTAIEDFGRVPRADFDAAANALSGKVLQTERYNPVRVLGNTALYDDKTPTVELEFPEGGRRVTVPLLPLAAQLASGAARERIDLPPWPALQRIASGGGGRAWVRDLRPLPGVPGRWLVQSALDNDLTYRILDEHGAIVGTTTLARRAAKVTQQDGEALPAAYLAAELARLAEEERAMRLVNAAAAAERAERTMTDGERSAEAAHQEKIAELGRAIVQAAAAKGEKDRGDKEGRATTALALWGRLDAGWALRMGALGVNEATRERWREEAFAAYEAALAASPAAPPPSDVSAPVLPAAAEPAPAAPAAPADRLRMGTVPVQIDDALRTILQADVSGYVTEEDRCHQLQDELGAMRTLAMRADLAPPLTFTTQVQYHRMNTRVLRLRLALVQAGTPEEHFALVLLGEETGPMRRRESSLGPDGYDVQVDVAPAPGLSYDDFRKAQPATRSFQRYDSDARALHAASHRLGHRQRQAVGEFYYTHPLRPGVAFDTAQAATRAAYDEYLTGARLAPDASAAAPPAAPVATAAPAAAAPALPPPSPGVQAALEWLDHQYDKEPRELVVMNAARVYDFTDDGKPVPAETVRKLFDEVRAGRTLLFNAPRPLPGEPTWMGDFLHGRFFAAVSNPMVQRDRQGNEYVLSDADREHTLKRISELDGWPVLLLTNEEVQEVIRQYVATKLRDDGVSLEEFLESYDGWPGAALLLHLPWNTFKVTARLSDPFGARQIAFYPDWEQGKSRELLHLMRQAAPADEVPPGQAQAVIDALTAAGFTVKVQIDAQQEIAKAAAAPAPAPAAAAPAAAPAPVPDAAPQGFVTVVLPLTGERAFWPIASVGVDQVVLRTPGGEERRHWLASGRRVGDEHYNLGAWPGEWRIAPESLPALQARTSAPSVAAWGSPAWRLSYDNLREALQRLQYGGRKDYESAAVLLESLLGESVTELPRDLFGALGGYHRAAIGKALRDGEPVPADVLGAYKGIAAAAPELGYVRRTPRPGTAARTTLEEGADQAHQAYERARTEKTEYAAKRGRSEAKLEKLSAAEAMARGEDDIARKRGHTASLEDLSEAADPLRAAAAFSALRRDDQELRQRIHQARQHDPRNEALAAEEQAVLARLETYPRGNYDRLEGLLLLEARRLGVPEEDLGFVVSSSANSLSHRPTQNAAADVEFWAMDQLKRRLESRLSDRPGGAADMLLVSSDDLRKLKDRLQWLKGKPGTGERIQELVAIRAEAEALALAEGKRRAAQKEEAAQKAARAAAEAAEAAEAAALRKVVEEAAAKADRATRAALRPAAAAAVRAPAAGPAPVVAGGPAPLIVPGSDGDCPVDRPACGFQIDGGVCSVEAPVAVQSDEGGAGSKREPARYCLVELDALRRSNLPLRNFAPNPDYPAGAQERSYQSDQAEQAKVLTNAQNFDAALIFNNSPSTESGPPVVTESRVVLGGNGRTMSTELVYAGKGGVTPQALREYLARVAPIFGFTAEQVMGLKKPMIVRTIRVPESDTERMAWWSRRLNASLAQGLDAVRMAVSRANFVKDDTLDLLRNLAEDETLTDYLSSQRSVPFVRALQADGVIDQQNSAQVLTGGLLNQRGREMVQDLLVAVLSPRAEVIKALGPKTVSVLAAGAPFLIAARSLGGTPWDLTGIMGPVTEDLLGARRQGASLDNYLSQVGLLSGGARVTGNPLATVLLRILWELSASPVKFARVARRFSADARGNHVDQGFLFAQAKKTPETSLREAAALEGVQLP